MGCGTRDVLRYRHTSDLSSILYWRHRCTADASAAHRVHIDGPDTTCLGLGLPILAYFGVVSGGQ